MDPKLRPICDALEVGNYREALQKCATMLKKQPNLTSVKALKALALDRMGMQQEALAVCQEIQWAKPTDESTLRTLSMVLQSAGKYEPMIKLYENASKVHPTNENLAVQWFMSVARTLDFKAQQTVALTLNKNFKRSKYMYWTIMSIALQGQKLPLLYQLAEKMMDKAAKEGKIESIEELQLYLIILQGQKDRHADALALLDGDIGLKTKAIDNVELRHLRIELLLKNQRWSEARDATIRILTEINQDDWRTFLQYFESIFLSVKSDELLQSDELAKAHQFLAELTQRETKNHKRGPFLAQIELEKRVQESTGALDSGKITELMVSYFKTFGSKTCCFEDLQAYFSQCLTSRTEAVTFCEKLREIYGDNNSTVKDIHVQINIMRFERFAGLHLDLSSSEAVALVNKLWQLYEAALPFGKDLEATERQYGDDYAIMAAHVLVDMHKQSKSSTPLLNAIIILEQALSASTHNYQMKLLLIRIYELLGAYKCAIGLYTTMGIKNVQHDTLSHYITDRALSFGLIDDGLAQCYEAHQIYHSNESETPEMILQAYKYSTFSKMQEFIEFQSRLENSIQKVIADRELLRLEFLKEDSVSRSMSYLTLLDQTNLKYDELFEASRADNRDVDVMLNWNPREQKSVEQLTRAVDKRLDAAWATLFTLVFRLLKAISNQAWSQDGVEDFDAMVKRLDQVLENRTGSLTAEEISLAKVIRNMSTVFRSVAMARTSAATSASVEEGMKVVVDSVKETLQATVKILKDRETIKSTGVMAWHMFHSLSSSVELAAYLNVINQALLTQLTLGSGNSNGIASSKGKKLGASQKAIQIAIQQFMVACKEFLVSVQGDVANLRNLASPSRLRSGLLYELCDESLLEIVRSPANKSKIEDIVLKIGTSWATSLVNLQQEASSRAVV